MFVRRQLQKQKESEFYPKTCHIHHIVLQVSAPIMEASLGFSISESYWGRNAKAPQHWH